MLEEHLEVVRAAQVWQLKSYQDVTISKLSQTYETLTKAGHDVSLRQKVQCTLRTSAEYLEAGQINEWAFAMSPALHGSGAIRFQDGEAWTPARASFALLTLPDPGDSQEEHDFFMAEWTRGVVNDHFITLVVDAGEHDDDIGGKGGAHSPGVQPLVTCVSSFLATQKGGSVNAVWAQSSAYIETMHIMRGLIALLDPRPLVFGSTIADVQFIMPAASSKRKRGDPEQPAPTTLENTLTIVNARALWRFLNKADDKGDHRWKDRYNAFIEYRPGENQYGEDVGRLEGLLAELDRVEAATLEKDLSPEHVETRTKALVQFTRFATLWRRSLRVGAIDEMERLLVRIWERLVSSAAARLESDVDGSSSEAVEILEGAKKSLAEASDRSGKAELLQTIMEVMAASRETSASRNLEVSLTTFLTSPSIEGLSWIGHERGAYFVVSNGQSEGGGDWDRSQEGRGRPNIG